MKKLWKKVDQALAWAGALAVSALAVVGGFLLLRKRKVYESSEEDLQKSFEASKKVAAAKLEAEDLDYELKIEKAKQQADDVAAALEHDPDKLAAALTKLSDD